MANETNSKLTWGLVISTYKREHVLPRCLRLGLTQTRQPVEMIVVDASPDWEKTRDLVLKTCSDVFPGRWFYERAQRQSLPAQRNQGLRLATADVVFLIDDDALMYPDCAEKIMAVYEADKAGLIVGVSPIRADRAPDEPDGGPGSLPAAKRTNRLLRWGGQFHEINHRFVPYDGQYPRHPLPPGVVALGVTPIELMGGYRMTYRRQVVVQEGFSDVLEGYSAIEDLDASYRVSRHGALVQTAQAKLCHLIAPGGRVSRFTKTALFSLNIGVLLAIHGPDKVRSQWRYRRLLLKRMAVEFLSDMVRKRWTLPQARGAFLAWRHVRTIFAQSPDELKSWYPGFQRSLLARDGQRG